MIVLYYKMSRYPSLCYNEIQLFLISDLMVMLLYADLNLFG